MSLEIKMATFSVMRLTSNFLLGDVSVTFFRVVFKSYIFFIHHSKCRQNKGRIGIAHYHAYRLSNVH